MKRNGFTLIELMVVIAIIGILATIITASLSTAKAKGRDAKRISDIKTIQTALALYYNDNQSYPKTLSSALTPNYIPVLPKDPGTNTDYKYAPIGNSPGICNANNVISSYHIGAVLETPGNSATMQDVDAAANPNVCSGSSDFNGQTGTAASPSTGCSGTQRSVTQNDPAITDETCYDWTP
jgi:prepilin-type N-terminal cleavage/methylation domain-containing protein